LLLEFRMVRWGGGAENDTPEFLMGGINVDELDIDCNVLIPNTLS